MRTPSYPPPHSCTALNHSIPSFRSRGLAVGISLVVYGREGEADILIQQITTPSHSPPPPTQSLSRGLAVGISLVVYGREEEADILIQQMTTDADPILRYGGMYAIAMAYRGTANNGAIRQLLHFAVSDVSDDVRRAAVLCLGFVLCAEPDQVREKQCVKRAILCPSHSLCYAVLCLGFVLCVEPDQ
ncbi:unnamed protein product, partial [Closterium sp. NIES-53]